MDLRAQLLIMETDTKTKPKTKNVLVYMMTQKPRLKSMSLHGETETE